MIQLIIIRKFIKLIIILYKNNQIELIINSLVITIQDKIIAKLFSISQKMFNQRK